MKVYLAGPINGCTDAEATGWRERVKALLPAGVGFLDPMSRDYRGRELEPGIAWEIVEGDKRDIMNAGACIFYFERPSVGSSMELMYAYEHGVPTVLLDMSGRALSPWALYHSTRVVSTIEDAVTAALDLAL